MTRRQLALLLVGLAFLLALPAVLTPNLVNAVIKMMIAALFALSFALAMGQAGMLSFGHSAYLGLGAFAALHTMQAVEQRLFEMPTPLIPLAGAAVGLFFGMLFGWFATQRSGVYFSMVTLALAELLFTLAPTWNSVFGGESGISSIRGPSWGINFGSDVDVYYLTLAWCALSAACLWGFTRTPLGRLALALRDNEHRVRFLGFNTHVARTLIFAISCMFTGVAGALLAIATEASNYTIFSAQASANVVLQTFIGGAGTFFGPALGAALMTFFARVTSDLTRSWLLYQGLIFVMIMLFLPEGLGGVIARHARLVKRGAARQLIAPYLLGVLVGCLLLAGFVFLVEVTHVLMSDAYQAKRRSDGGAFVPFELFGFVLHPASVRTWLIPAVLLAAGGLFLPLAQKRIQHAWIAATGPPDAPGAQGAPGEPPAAPRETEGARA